MTLWFVIGLGFVGLGCFSTLVLGQEMRRAQRRVLPAITTCIAIAACSYLGIHSFVAYLRSF